MTSRFVISGISLAMVAQAWAQTDPVALDTVAVTAPRVANAEPAGAVATPVTALRFEPRMDVQARNMAEGQADLSIRGSTFENVGLRVGALSVYDPQTGHYTMELPISPAMLTAPSILTGLDQALVGQAATSGLVSYGWAPITTRREVAVSAGNDETHRESAYVAQTVAVGAGGRLGADVDVAHSESEGAVENGDHDISRLSGRLQYATAASQTDLFAGYQEKRFGWPNLYTPFNSPEFENLQTVLTSVNHRLTYGAEKDTVEVGAYYRRNKDDYAFNRYAAVGAVHPFQHTTWVYGASLDGRSSFGSTLAVRYRAGVIGDEIDSSSLLFGRYRTRTQMQVGAYPEKTFALAGGRSLVASAGTGFEDSNRAGSVLTPAAGLTFLQPSAPISAWHLSYAKTTQLPTYTALNASPTSGLFRGNANLGRSITHAVEAGARGRVGAWEIEGALFHRQDDRLVDWTYLRGVTARSANAVDIATDGVELFARRSWRRLDLALGYAGLLKDADYGAAKVDASFYALNFPKHRVTAAVVARLTTEWEVRWDNEFRVQQDNALRRIGGDEALLSAVGVYYRPSRVRGLTLSAQVDNAFDSRFEEVPAVPASHPAYSVGAAYRW